MIRTIRGELSNTLPILIIPTKGEERDRDVGISPGADGYLTKPLDSKVFRYSVAKYLKGEQPGHA